MIGASLWPPSVLALQGAGPMIGWFLNGIRYLCAMVRGLRPLMIPWVGSLLPPCSDT